MPIFHHSGGRDYQSTVEDFKLWQDGLAQHPDATCELFDNLNHLFAVGEGKAVPDEYMEETHVDPDVIELITRWCRGGRVNQSRRSQVAERGKDQFINDPELIGNWKSVDFVPDISVFDPAKKHWPSGLFLKKLMISRNGKTDKPAWKWTKGKILNTADKLEQRYEIRGIGGESYLFLEWKTPDDVSKHRKCNNYVLKKEDR